MHKNVY